MRWQSPFLVEYLASHGFVVVAPDHTGNTIFDYDSGRMPEVARRPHDIIDAADWLKDTAPTWCQGSATAWTRPTARGQRSLFAATRHRARRRTHRSRCDRGLCDRRLALRRRRADGERPRRRHGRLQRPEDLGLDSSGSRGLRAVGRRGGCRPYSFLVLGRAGLRRPWPCRWSPSTAPSAARTRRSTPVCGTHDLPPSAT